MELDVDQFSACLDDNKYNNTVQDNRQAAGQVGVTGTPAFFINDVSLAVARPFAEFQ